MSMLGVKGMWWTAGSRFRMYGGAEAVLGTEGVGDVGSGCVYRCETRRCMKVVLPLPAMPMQTMQTGVVDGGAEGGA